MWKKFDSFEIDTNFFAWACKIARLQTLKHYDRNRRGGTLLDRSVLEKLSRDAMQFDAGRQMPLEALESCLAGLSESDRKLIRRRYEPHTTVNQIAAEIGLSANMLSKSLGKIRRVLLACVERKLAREW